MAMELQIVAMVSRTHRFHHADPRGLVRQTGARLERALDPRVPLSEAARRFATPEVAHSSVGNLEVSHSSVFLLLDR